MRFHKIVGLMVSLICLGMVLTTASSLVEAAPNFAHPLFSEAWNRADRAVEQGVAGSGRSWTWGPNVFGPSSLQELYAEAPGGLRTVEYFDKARMELRYPNGNSAATPILTTGLLVNELVTGQLQVGDTTFISRPPAEIVVAGDSAEVNPAGPVYASFKSLLNLSSTNRSGSVVTERINKQGQVSSFSPPLEVKYDHFEAVTQHNVAKVFDDFMNATGPIWNGTTYVIGKIYTDNPTANVFGYPVSEPYWSKTSVKGLERDVLIQLFQRRVLTYTPANSPAFQVEMGNLGQHYYQWRYNSTNSNPVLTPTPTTGTAPTPTPTTGTAPTPTPTPTSSSSSSAQPNIRLTGKGSGNTVTFTLTGGVALFKSSDTSKEIFLAELIATDNTQVVAGLVAMGAYNYSGSHYIKVPHPGTYFLTIRSTGDWSIEITDFSILQSVTAVSPPHPISGKGDTAGPKIKLDAGIYNVKGTQQGGQDFVVTLLNSAGNYERLLFDDSGAVNRTVSMEIKTGGDFYVDVSTEGSWTLDFIK
jgi:hypothetical protein